MISILISVMISVWVSLNGYLDPLLDLGAAYPSLLVTVSAVVVGVIAMIIYKYTSMQSGIKDAKDKIKGHFYEVWLFIDDAAVIVGSQARILYNAGRYLVFALPPLAIMIVIFFPLFANLETRLAIGPAKPGESVLVKVRLDGYFEGWEDAVKLDLPEGVEMVGYPIRLLRKNKADSDSVQIKSRDYEVNYKLRAPRAGLYQLHFDVDGQGFEVPFLVGVENSRPTPFVTASLGTALLFPPAATIPDQAPVRHVEIAYPEADMNFLGWHTWWIWPFLIVSMIAAFAVKGVFKVEI